MAACGFGRAAWAWLKMEIEPVEKIEPPAYPSGEELADAKAMLSAHFPSRWRTAKGLAGAMAVALAANCSGGCSSEFDNGGNQPVDVSRATAAPPASFGVRVDPADPSFMAASDWVRSIFESQSQSRVILGGDILIVTPTVNEGEVPGILHDRTQ